MKKRIINKEDYPMVLDWSEYKNTHTKLPCKCMECDANIVITINEIDIRNHSLCKKCTYKKNGIKLRKEINKEDYPMVVDWDNYETVSTPLYCKCDICGNMTISNITKINKNGGSLCKKCVVKKRGMSRRKGINKEDYPMVVDWDNYETKKTKLPYRCPECNTIITTSIKRLEKEGQHLCKKCSDKKSGGKNKRVINKEDYPMVVDWEKYKNVITKLPCKCSGCGKIVFKTIYRLDTEKTCFCYKCGINIKCKQTNMERYKVENPFQSTDIKEKIKQTNMEKYDVPYSCMTDNCRSTSKTISNINLKWYNIIKEKLDVECEKEFPIQNQSFDIKMDKILIEINPTFSHNSTYGYAYAKGISETNTPIKPDYHFNKWKLAKDNGYTLISIFDNMDKNKTISIIRSKLGLNETKVGARKCEIKEIPQKECNVFLEQHHVQGKATGQKACVGLFYNNDLVGVMTFGNPRFNKKYEWELVRLCFKENITIQGGVSKMWSYFKNTYNPTSCICYLNLNLGGDTMTGTDFTFKQYNKPAGYWEHTKTGRTITNNSLRMRGASRFIGDDDLIKYPKGMDNREIMKLEGFVEMYDCGNVVYEYKKVDK